MYLKNYYEYLQDIDGAELVVEWSSPRGHRKIPQVVIVVTDGRRRAAAVHEPLEIRVVQSPRADRNDRTGSARLKEVPLKKRVLLVLCCQHNYIQVNLYCGYNDDTNHYEYLVKLFIS